MKKIMFLLFLISFAIGSSQNLNLKAIKKSLISFTADEFLGYDQFGFYYTLDNNVFSKISEQETFQYKNVSLGKIAKVDLQNPLKIVLFYENFNTIVTLDNQLNESQKINFSESSIPIVVTAIGLSAQNKLWISNSMNQQLGLYDYLNNNYNTISVPFIEPSKIYSSDFNNFYWIDAKNNFYSCDVFGKVTFIELIPDFESISIINENKFLYSKNAVIILRDIEKDKNYQIEISEKSFEKFYYRDQILSIFTIEGITNYKITIP
ncbi:hypothetical protein [Flavobacterium segetis]|nr:hypothetical protein [Flavobacterium segetis]